MKQICIDTGVLDIYFSASRTELVKNLMASVKKSTCSAHIIKPILSEIFFHLCRTSGASEATVQLTNFLNNYPVILVELDRDLYLSAGKIRCQHASTLSYIDCMSIVYCLSTNTEFHTTEKTIKRIPHNTLSRLRIVEYTW